MKYLFILGRNPDLSRMEIRSYLKRTDNVILDEERVNNGLMLELENPLDAGAIDLLGGTIGIGIVISPVKDIDKKTLYYGTQNSFNYLLWDFSPATQKVSDYLRRRFHSERLRAVEKKFDNQIKTQSGATVAGPSSGLIHEEFFVFNNLFGRIVQKCNYKALEMRDMEKPVRREDLSISPRLAKIMINLSEVKEGEVLLDAFCGIGVIMIEALNMDIKATGIDKDSEAWEGARRNLEWFKFARENYKLIIGDSTKLKISPVNVMVSEPDFGSTLRKFPDRKEAEKMIKNFENLMIDSLKNLKGNISGKIVLTLPSIATGNGRVSADLMKICDKTGLKVEDGFPIQEYREDQIVGREIVVLMK